jgi:hypothetical protein
MKRLHIANTRIKLINLVKIVVTRKGEMKDEFKDADRTK